MNEDNENISNGPSDANESVDGSEASDNSEEIAPQSIEECCRLLSTEARGKQS